MKGHIRRSGRIFALALPLVGASLVPSAAHAFDLGYGGRLVDEQGQPLAGSADILVRFFSTASGSTQLGTTQTYAATPLVDGTFQLQLGLDAALVEQLFGDTSQSVYIEIEALGRVYPRQRLLPVPSALRVPIDTATLAFDTDGLLTVNQVDAGQVAGLAGQLAAKADAAALAGKADSAHAHALSDVTGLATALAGKADANAALSGDVGGSLAATSVDRIKGVAVAAPASGADSGKYLQYDGTSFVLAPITGASGGTVTSVTVTPPLAVSNGSTTPALSLSQANGSTDGFLAAADFTAFSGKQAAITTASTLDAGTVTTAQRNGLEVKPYGTGAGQTGELRFDELAANGGNYVGFKAPDTLSGDQVWTLPAADGTSGQLLSTSGSGALTWVSGAAPTGVAGGDLTGSFPSPTLAASGVTPGSYAKVTVDEKGRVTSGNSTITSSDIEDGTIANVDISGTAAIATSKLAGAVTSISGHGLGGLATLSAVSTSEITDGTIANADISGTAGIATSKLSGALTAVSGHGLGTLATLSAVGTSEIADGTITNADVSGAAAIETSKLSGPVTSIASHGLGALATLSAVGAGEITDGAIADADVSGTAAIATSKISGAVTQVAGHGLGALATLSTVGSTEINDGAIIDADISGTASIASSKINFADDGISGDKVHGGTISNFASTGIDDNAASNAMTINGSGNVGVGTTEPIDPLTVNSSGGVVRETADIYGPKISFYKRGTTGDATAVPAAGQLLGFTAYHGWNGTAYARGSYIGSGVSTPFTATNSGSYLTFFTTNDGSTTNTERMRITGGGNVGIGTTSPAAPLDVASSTTGVAVRAGNSASAFTSNQLLLGWAGTNTYQHALKTRHQNGAASGNAFDFYVWNFGTDTSTTVGTKHVMTLDGTGNVGIGTISPGGLLHVASGGTTSPLAATAIFGNTATTYGLSDTVVGANLMFAGMGRYNGWLSYYPSRADGKPYFRMESSSSAYADNPVGLLVSGNVGIGTTAPTSALTVVGTARNASAILNATSTINFATGNLQYTNANCGAFDLHNIQDGGSYTLTVKGTTSATCSFTAYSDAGSTALTVHMPPNHAATTATKHTMYGFLVVGTDVYVSWTPGY